MLALQRALRGVFFRQKQSKNKIIRIYYEICVFMYFCKKRFVVYHDLDHDKQHPCASPVGKTSGGFFQEKKASEKTRMRTYKKNVHLFVFLRRLIKYAPSPPTLPPPWFPPKPSSILNQAGPAWDPGNSIANAIAIH